jgi:hypothetical protein
MPVMTKKCVISEVKFVYLLLLRNFYFLNHLNNTKLQQIFTFTFLNYSAMRLVSF